MAKNDTVTCRMRVITQGAECVMPDNDKIFDLIPPKAPWSELNPLLMSLTGLWDLKTI